MPNLRFPEFELLCDDDQVRMTGCLERQTTPEQLQEVGVSRIWRPGERTPGPILPKAMWQPQDSVEPFEANYECQNDQNGYPACTLASLATFLDFLRVIFGMALGKLDWHWLWNRLSGGRGGVALDTALRWVTDKGFPLKDKSGVEIVTEVWDIPDVSTFYSALQCSSIALVWYGRYTRGGGGHAEVAAWYWPEGAMPGHGVPGTWGRRYGENGYYRQTVTQRDINAFGAFGIRSIRLEKKDLEAEWPSKDDGSKG